MCAGAFLLPYLFFSAVQSAICNPQSLPTPASLRVAGKCGKQAGAIGRASPLTFTPRLRRLRAQFRPFASFADR